MKGSKIYLHINSYILGSTIGQQRSYSSQYYAIKPVLIKKFLDNRLITKELWVTEGTRTLDIQNHNLTL